MTDERMIQLFDLFHSFFFIVHVELLTLCIKNTQNSIEPKIVFNMCPLASKQHIQSSFTSELLLFLCLFIYSIQSIFYLFSQLLCKIYVSSFYTTITEKGRFLFKHWNYIAVHIYTRKHTYTEQLKIILRIVPHLAKRG